MRLQTAVLVAVLAMPLCAQQRDVYKVDFTIRDSSDAGGKTGRKYSLLVYGQDKGVFKIGNRVPVATSSNGGGNMQFTYVDVGINIDVTLQEAVGKIGMRADLDLSTAIVNEKMPNISPTISQIKVAISTAIPPGSPPSWPLSTIR